MDVSVEESKWLDAPHDVKLFTVKTPNAIMCLSNYGATVQYIQLRNPNTNEWIDVTCGFDKWKDYSDSSKNPYFGATVGRYANRIAHGKFRLNGSPVELATNNGPNHLHGGPEGFHRQLYTATIIQTTNDVGVAFRRDSAFGEEGYPSTLEVTVSYFFSGLSSGAGIGCSPVDLCMKFDVKNIGRVPTIANVVNHIYWNLDGYRKQTTNNEFKKVMSKVTDSHTLWLNAPFYTPVDAHSIPTGEIRSVAGTPFDFYSSPQSIGASIQELDATAQLGYDHNFVLKKSSLLGKDEAIQFQAKLLACGDDNPIDLAARLSSSTSGLSAEVFTTYPGVQFYSGNFLPQGSESRLEGLDGVEMSHRCGLCLEAQYFPDTPNHNHFPSPKLEPNEQRVDWQIYRFSFANE